MFVLWVSPMARSAIQNGNGNVWYVSDCMRFMECLVAGRIFIKLLCTAAMRKMVIMEPLPTLKEGPWEHITVCVCHHWWVVNTGFEPQRMAPGTCPGQTQCIRSSRCGLSNRAEDGRGQKPEFDSSTDQSFAKLTASMFQDSANQPCQLKEFKRVPHELDSERPGEAYRNLHTGQPMDNCCPAHVPLTETCLPVLQVHWFPYYVSVSPFNLRCCFARNWRRSLTCLRNLKSFELSDANWEALSVWKRWRRHVQKLCFFLARCFG